MHLVNSSAPESDSVPRNARPTRRRKVVRAVLIGLGVFVACEAVATLLYQQSLIYPDAVWYWEHTGDGSTMEFDPILGYRLTRNPRRMVCMGTNGEIEAVATVRGNNAGFSDRDDFNPKRLEPQRKRLAVFGDSFTAGLYLERSWPDAVEDRAEGNNRPLELMNFSIYAGGLVNWCSVLTGVIEKEKYELDGVVFAVFRGNLRRGFTISDDRSFFNAPGGYACMSVGRIPVESDSLPMTFEDARPYFAPVFGSPIVNTVVLEQILRGRPRMPRSFQPVLSRLCWHGIKKSLGVTEMDLPDEVTESAKFPPHIRRRLEVIRSFLAARQIRSLVIAVPSRERLLDGLPPSQETRAFAEFLGADFIDGAEAFEGQSAGEIRDHWLKYDGHWGQSGSDQFARHFTGVISDWADR